MGEAQDQQHYQIQCKEKALEENQTPLVVSLSREHCLYNVLLTCMLHAISVNDLGQYSIVQLSMRERICVGGVVNINPT